MKKMQETLKRWQYVAGFFAFVAICWSVWRVGEAFGIDGAGWPAWVQALGSIIAVAAAIYVMHRQNENAMRLFKLERLAIKDDRLSAALAVVIYIQNAALEISDCFKSHDAASEYLLGGRDPILSVNEYLAGPRESAISKLVNALSVIPPLDLQSYKAVKGVLDLKRSLESLDSYVKKLEFDPYFQKIRFEEAAKGIHKIKVSIDKAAQDLTSELAVVQDEIRNA